MSADAPCFRVRSPPIQESDRMLFLLIPSFLATAVWFPFIRTSSRLMISRLISYRVRLRSMASWDESEP